MGIHYSACNMYAHIKLKFSYVPMMVRSSKHHMQLQSQFQVHKHSLFDTLESTIHSKMLKHSLFTLKL